MSMRDYGFDEYGLLLDDKLLKMIILSDYPDCTDEEYENNAKEYAYDLYERGVIQMESDFTGEAHTINDNGRTEWWEAPVYFNDDTLFYVPTLNAPCLFSAAYESMGDLLAEFETALSGYIPVDYDLRPHVYHIVGTYYG